MPASPQSDKPCSPVIDEGPYGFEHVNVAEQRRDPNSMLNWTERIIRMRKEVPEIGWGDFKVIADARPGGAGDALRLAQQFGAVRAQSRSRSRARSRSRSACPETTASSWSICWPKTTATPMSAASTRLLLEAYGYRWFRVGGLDYLLKRSDIDVDAAGKAGHPA